jgi:hypothetical protein
MPSLNVLHFNRESTPRLSPGDSKQSNFRRAPSFFFDSPSASVEDAVPACKFPRET